MADVPLHIIQRGNNSSACFFADGDYRLYLDVLGQHATANQCAVHAWCLMTNHVHLLLTRETGSDAVFHGGSPWHKRHILRETD
jgi:putative transposase